jgi:hypothetical protein
MPTPIDKGKFRSRTQLAAAVYPTLQSDGKAPRPKYEPATGDWWDQSPYKEKREQASKSLTQRWMELQRKGVIK